MAQIEDINQPIRISRSTQNAMERRAADRSKALRFPSNIGQFPLTAIFIYKVNYEYNNNSTAQDILLAGTAAGEGMAGGVAYSTAEGLASAATFVGLKNDPNGVVNAGANTAVKIVSETRNFLDTGIKSGFAERKIENVVQIFLPLPIDIQAQYDASWGGRDLSVIQYTLRQLHENSTNPEFTGDAVRGGIIKNLVSRFAGSGIVRGVAGASGALGIGYNPYRELMYDGPSFRQFSLSWVVSPKNKKESDELNEIIWNLKKHMHPSTNMYNGEIKDIEGVPTNVTPKWGNNMDDSYLYRFPEFCTVELWSNDEDEKNPYLFKMHDLAITNLTVRYDNKLHKDTKAPASVSITMSFLESKLLTQNDFGTFYDKSQISY